MEVQTPHWSEDLGEIDSHSPPNIKREQELESLGSPFAMNAPLPFASPRLPMAHKWSTSSSDLPSSSLLLEEDSDDRIASLERSICSNYSCCGIDLPDFHALVHHFDNYHVTVVTSTGKRIVPGRDFPSESTQPVASSSKLPEPITAPSSPTPSNATLDSLASTPACSRSSSVVSSPPMPVTPLSSAGFFPVFEPAAIDQCFPYLGVDVAMQDDFLVDDALGVISPFGPEYDIERDYACYEHTYAEKETCAASADMDERREQIREFQAAIERDLAEYDSALSSPAGSPPPTTFEHELLDSLQTPATSTDSKKTVFKYHQKEESEASNPSSNNGGKVIKTKPRPTVSIPTGAPATGRKREKAYKCPHRGCVKAYLNPNGLKYHLEKGTCKFEDAAFHDSSATSASPSSNSSYYSSNRRSSPPSSSSDSESDSPSSSRSPRSAASGPSWDSLAPSSHHHQYSSPSSTSPAEPYESSYPSRADACEKAGSADCHDADENSSSSRFAAVYSHHLHVHPSAPTPTAVAPAVAAH